MAITQAMCVSFKLELLEGIHNFTGGTGDTFKIALYTSSASLDSSTTLYSTTNEITGSGYTAGGVALTSVTPIIDGTIACADFIDATWATVTISGVRGALIYNSSKSNKAVMVLDFGSDRSASGSNFVVTFPSPDQSSAIIRVQ
jgi:hypothetical protein